MPKRKLAIAPLSLTLGYAAMELRETATELRNNHTVRGRWDGTEEDARLECERLNGLAKALERAKKYFEPNSLGGPARQFQVMADRISAGDSFNSVLADYGFMVKPKRKRT